MATQTLQPCPWAQGADYLHYHDTEWGVPCYDRNHLFEKLCLEGQQAGLSWITVLRKRAAYREVFANFIPEQLANFTDKQLDVALQDERLIRHKLKIYSLRTNAQALLALEAKGINFVDFIWQHVESDAKTNKQPLVNNFASLEEVPTQTPASVALSKALKKAGFTFVGPVNCYAFIQSKGLVNDHLTNCPQHPNNLL